MRPVHWLASPGVSLLAGGAQALSIADPWSGQPHWWLQLASLALLAWQLVHRAERQVSWSASTWVTPETGTSWRTGLWRGWLFGLGWLAGTFWWLYISMHTYGGLAAPLAIAAVLALAGLLALYYALAAAAFMALAPARLLARSPGVSRTLSHSALAGEAIRKVSCAEALAWVMPQGYTSAGSRV